MDGVVVTGTVVAAAVAVCVVVGVLVMVDEIMVVVWGVVEGLSVIM